MKSIDFHPGDYDSHGRVRLPFLFWCVLLLQARTWVLFLMAGASRQQGDALLNGTNIYVCEICGFVYVGNEPPEICPVCKVPNLKISMIVKEAV